MQGIDRAIREGTGAARSAVPGPIINRAQYAMKLRLMDMYRMCQNGFAFIFKPAQNACTSRIKG